MSANASSIFLVDAVGPALPDIRAPVGLRHSFCIGRWKFMSQTDTESAVDVKLPFPAIRRELPTRHPENTDTMEEIAQSIDKPVLAAKLTKLSVVIPVYNEEATVQTLVSLVVNAPLPDGLRREIICVNDCSRDGTAKKLDELPKLFPEADFRIIHKPVNEGKGAALRDGFKHASGDIVLIQDADLEYDPADYPKLLQPILENRADVVYGSRFMGAAPHRVLYFWHTLGNRVLTMMSNMFTNLNLTDMEVCYKVFRKSVLDRIQVKCNRFGFEPEITAKIAKLRPRIRIFEVGISYYGRSYEEGKKITWKDGVKAILAIIRFRFSD
jgi:glycosyltransferase involved in cell wall biosynthesis